MQNIKYNSDWNLLDLYLKGDREAGNRLFSSIYPDVRRFVYKRLYKFGINDDYGSDIIAESMKRALQKIHFYNGSVPFKNFVIGFADKVLKEYIRKQKKDSVTVEFDDTNTILGNCTEFTQNPIDYVVTLEEQSNAQKAFSNLSEDHQQILRLRLFNKLPVKKISEMTGKTESAIDSLYRRALATLRENFKKIDL